MGIIILFDIRGSCQFIGLSKTVRTIANESEYFITGIESAHSSIGACFDILAIPWLASQPRNSGNCLRVLIKMKYAEGPPDGAAGLIKRLADIEKPVSDKERSSSLLATMEKPFNQLDEPEFHNFNR